MQLLVATRNAHKTREIQEILGNAFEVQDLSAHPEIPIISETGKTFEENAVLKAITISKNCAGMVVADDSGLEVDALGGRPGIFSARYTGENATDKQNIEKLLRELTGPGTKIDERRARFRCVIALASRGELVRTFEGGAEGTIVDAARGEQGFGYDPIFLPNGFDKTFGELTAETKNRISHRARALEQLARFLD